MSTSMYRRSTSHLCANIYAAFAVMVIAIVFGGIVGLILRATRGKMEVMFNDDTDFIKSEEPKEAVAK